MKRSVKEACGGVGDDTGLLKQRKEEIDWVAALQSPSVVAALKEDIMRVLEQGPNDDEEVEWRGAGPDPLAFLEDLAQTLSLEG